MFDNTLALILLVILIVYILYTTIRISFVKDTHHHQEHLICEYKRPNDSIFFNYFIIISFNLDDNDEVTLD